MSVPPFSSSFPVPQLAVRAAREELCTGRRCRFRADRALQLAGEALAVAAGLKPALLFDGGAAGPAELRRYLCRLRAAGLARGPLHVLGMAGAALVLHPGLAGRSLEAALRARPAPFMDVSAGRQRPALCGQAEAEAIRGHLTALLVHLRDTETTSSTLSSPASSNPAPSNPASSSPASSKPASSSSMSSSTTSSRPAPSNPASFSPTSSSPASSQPASSNPALPSPPSSSTLSCNPVSSCPASSSPAPSNPASSNPVSSSPVPSDSVSCSEVVPTGWNLCTIVGVLLGYPAAYTFTTEEDSGENCLALTPLRVFTVQAACPRIKDGLVVQIYSFSIPESLCTELKEVLDAWCEELKEAFRVQSDFVDLHISSEVVSLPAVAL